MRPCKFDELLFSPQTLENSIEGASGSGSVHHQYALSPCLAVPVAVASLYVHCTRYKMSVLTRIANSMAAASHAPAAAQNSTLIASLVAVTAASIGINMAFRKTGREYAYILLLIPYRIAMLDRRIATDDARIHAAALTENPNAVQQVPS